MKLGTIKGLLTRMNLGYVRRLSIKHDGHEFNLSYSYKTQHC